LATQLVAALAFLGQQPPLDDSLRGDPRMIGAGHPEGVVALHAAHADQDVLQRIVEGMSQVQRAGDIGRRDDDAVRRSRGIGLAVKVAVPFPKGIPARLRCGMVVLFGKLRGESGRCGHRLQRLWT
jgi:hypothetical protein